MIISHEFRYVFVQVPQTASSSIGTELCDNYGGEPILYKHATYDEFLGKATEEEKSYFSFAGVRNPLDCLVTEFFRRKAGKRIRENPLHYEKYIYIRDNQASFADFMKKFHSHFHKAADPYCRGVDFIYRYENLQEDFSRVLSKMGIEQIRPLPRFNRSPGKTGSFLSYYTPEIQPMVRMVLRGRMKRAGYQFPGNWRKIGWMAPALLTGSLFKTILFSLRLLRLRRRRPSPGAHDSYSTRLRKTYVEGEDPGKEEQPGVPEDSCRT